MAKHVDVHYGASKEKVAKHTEKFSKICLARSSLKEILKAKNDQSSSSRVTNSNDLQVRKMRSQLGRTVTIWRICVLSKDARQL